MIESSDAILTHFRGDTLHLLLRVQTRVSAGCGCELLFGSVPQDEDRRILVSACDELHEGVVGEVARTIARLGAHNVTPEQADAILTERVG